MYPHCVVTFDIKDSRYMTTVMHTKLHKYVFLYAKIYLSTYMDKGRKGFMRCRRPLQHGSIQANFRSVSPQHLLIFHM